MGKEYGMIFPKGASSEVEEAGRKFIEQHGVDKLPKVAKTHFKTVQKIKPAGL